ncbi:MAG: hypothetical protein M1816_006709 [Peltula sp. TS41687]|nr:MAG: hypothetical protein M1816_006709 [Peltula sp. TS41687]
MAGSAVATLSPGDRVALEPGVPCRHCAHCKDGHYNLCSSIVFAATPPYDGTLAKYYLLPQDFCYKLPEHVSLEEGALVEPLSVAVHMVRQANVKPGQTLVVFGAGPVGLLCCAVGKVFGASKIIAVEIVPERLEFAAKYAATDTFTPSRSTSSEENAANLIRENQLGEGADVAIDASGAQASIQMAIHVLRPGGTFVQGGMGIPEVVFPITLTCVKELHVRGSFRYSAGDYELGVDLLSAGKVSVKELISAKVPFRDAEKAFQDVLAGRGIKTLIEGVED